MLFLRLFIVIAGCLIVSSNATESESEDKSKVLLKKLFVRRREEQFLLQKKLASNDNYFQKFRLLKIAIQKVFEIIQENKKLLPKESLKPAEIPEAKMLVIENTCMIMDFVLNFNRIVYNIFDKLEFDWFTELSWCLVFVKENVDILDELTTKEFDFITENIEAIKYRQELDNPFENNIREFEPKPVDPKKAKKIRKKLKKGPSLNDAMKFEL
ncbi:unnamed protein product [Diamesa serratosioi]